MDENLLNQQLNPVQRKAVEDTEGAVLVLAGAGSGKTRVLTHRICHIVNTGLAKGWNVLAVTFTNKAAAEMKERIAAMLGEDNNVWVSTIHSFCSSVLRRFIGKLGYESNFSIYSEADRERVIKRVLREKHVENQDDEMGEVISRVKNEDIKPVEFLRVFGKEQGELFYEVYDAYERSMKDNNALDFDDLLLKTRELFLNHPDALEYYQDKLKYIHVDEFQDTNAVQMELINLLAAKHGNLFVVGDDDQSIYGWRGAKIRNILDFDKKYPDAKVYKLEQNYRSTPQILSVANNVIKHNKSRHEKTLFTEKNAGARVEFYNAYNDRQEADFVVDTISSLIRYEGYSAKDFAILVRNNSLSRLFEQRLNSARMSYRVYGGFKFFDRKEVLDVMAYLRILINSRDNEAVERIINVPRRGIGETTVEKLVEVAKTRGTDLFGALETAATSGDFNGKTAQKLSEFHQLLSRLFGLLELPLYELVKNLVEIVDFESSLKSTDKEEDYNRWLNIEEFVNYVKEYADKTPNANLIDFVASCTLVTTGDVDNGEFVTVATIHAVKGLEFPVVFVAACEETILPSSIALKESEENGLEEERRLMYVAVTRAKERLFITSASQRFRYGQVQGAMQSRFIGEAKGGQATFSKSAPERGFAKSSGKKRADDVFVTSLLAKKEPPKPREKSAANVASGKRVSHPRYGEGIVLVVDGDTVSVLFKDLGVKKFSLSAAPLTVL